MSYNKIELLAPAGSAEALNAAIGEGADAVYLGLKDFNARQRSKNFSYKQLEAIVDKLHKIDKKVYIALNTVFEQRESIKIYNLLKYLSLVNPDGIIVQDTGIISLAREYFSGLKIHASTQMNISSSKAVNQLSRSGVTRVILSRELSLDQIRTIRLNTNLELEIFVHGALCISLSGACLFSSFLGGKSANRGWCTQPCRRIYLTEKRKGSFFSTNDLMLIDYIPEIINMGINCIKLEGRMRSAEYTAVVVRAYRYLIDNFENDNEKALNEAKLILETDLARSKTDYFFVNKHNTKFLNFQSTGTGSFLGRIKNITKRENITLAHISCKKGLQLYDNIRIHSSNDEIRESVKITELHLEENEAVFNIPGKFRIGDSVYLISRKDKKSYYEEIIPKKLDKYKRHPGNLQVPVVIKKKSNFNPDKIFKSGYYIRINNFRNIYITQSIRPEKIIIDLNKENANFLKLKFQNLIYNKNDIIIYLDPYFPESQVNWYAAEINELIEKGYKNFVINNLGYLSILPVKKINLIAGSYLYSFNYHSINFLLDSGCDFLISPIENNKQNLFRSTDRLNKHRWFITIFSFPELFQIETDYYKALNINQFSDRFNNIFNIIAEQGKTVVVPDRAFSINDKIPLLKKHNFNKFIIDLSYVELKKNYYKNLIKTIDSAKPIESTSRFNWKSGFYS